MGANELYVLHCFGSSLACLDCISSTLSIYGYYVLRDHERKQFVQIESSELEDSLLRLIEGNEDI